MSTTQSLPKGVTRRFNLSTEGQDMFILVHLLQGYHQQRQQQVKMIIRLNNFHLVKPWNRVIMMDNYNNSKMLEMAMGSNNVI